MSRLPAATAALNVTTTKDVDTLVDGQTHTSSNCLPFSVSQFPPAQQLYSTTIPRDTNKINLTDDEQCGVDEGYRAKSNKQADDEQFDVRNDTTAGKNSSNQTDDEQREVQYVTEASGIKTVSQFTIIEQQGDLLHFTHSKAHCISADFKQSLASRNQSKKNFRVFYL